MAPPQTPQKTYWPPPQFGDMPTMQPPEHVRQVVTIPTYMIERSPTNSLSTGSSSDREPSVMGDEDQEQVDEYTVCSPSVTRSHASHAPRSEAVDETYGESSEQVFEESSASQEHHPESHSHKEAPADGAGTIPQAERASWSNPQPQYDQHSSNTLVSARKYSPGTRSPQQDTRRYSEPVFQQPFPQFQARGYPPIYHPPPNQQQDDHRRQQSMEYQKPEPPRLRVEQYDPSRHGPLPQQYQSYQPFQNQAPIPHNHQHADPRLDARSPPFHPHYNSILQPAPPEGYRNCSPPQHNYRHSQPPPNPAPPEGYANNPPPQNYYTQSKAPPQVALPPPPPLIPIPPPGPLIPYHPPFPPSYTPPPSPHPLSPLLPPRNPPTSPLPGSLRPPSPPPPHPLLLKTTPSNRTNGLPLQT